MIQPDDAVRALEPTLPPKKRAAEQSLAKANEAIAMRPKRGRLTLLSRRIYNALLYHAQRQGVDEPLYSLPLAQLIGDARFNSNNTELLKTHLRDMQATTIEWSTSGAGQKRWVSTQLLGTVAIDEPGRGRPCIITWRYPDEIRERLLKPNQYTRVLLEISSQMRSYSAAVLYELGARYLTSPGKLTMREDTVWWAAVLTGRSDIKEVDYRFLKRDVISKAIAEVDALCDDFTLELVEHKRGRKVEEIQFRIVPKAQRALGPLHNPAHNVFDLALVGRLRAIGFKQQEAQDIYAATDEGEIRAALSHVELRQRNRNLPELKSPIAYFRDALKKRYASFTEEGGGQGAKLPPPAKPTVRTDADRMFEIRDAWETERIKTARELYSEMGDAQKAEVRQGFEAEALSRLPAPVVSAWRRDGASSRIAGSSFFRWLASTTWPEEPTDKVLLDFAVAKGAIKFG